MTEVRSATPADAAGINSVYNPYVRDTASTFDVEEISLDARRRWLEERLADPRTPVLVGLENGRIVAFASASPFDPRGAYETSVKTAVFAAPGLEGAGWGRRLYAPLFERIDRQDVHRAYAGIVVPNDRSVGLHKAFGFHQIATYSEVGRKFGRYYDVMWFERRNPRDLR
jgi:phosphinothricin acetyltransferase